MPPPTYTDEEKIAIRSRQNGRVLCIVTKDKKFPYKWYSDKLPDTVKFAAPTEMSLNTFRMELYKSLKALNGNTPITDAIYLSCNNRVVGGNNILMGDLAKSYGHLGMIYIIIHGENTFG